MANPTPDQTPLKIQATMPRDGNATAMQLVPDTTALAVTNNGSIGSSTTVTLQATTSLIEVSALSQGVYLKYGTTAVTSSNFDEYIQAGTTRHYKIPAGITAVTVLQQAATATVIIIEK